MAAESHERIVAELAKDVNRDDLDTLVFDVSKYQQYSSDSATVVFARRSEPPCFSVITIPACAKRP